MKTYILTSEKFTGEIELRYNGMERLISYDNRAKLTVEQYDYIVKHLPNVPGMLPMFAANIKSKATKIDIELTFEMFWKQYFFGRDKDNSSKKRAETKWNRMSKSEQAKAYSYINVYMSRITYVPKHAETYLNSELWNG